MNELTACRQALAAFSLDGRRVLLGRDPHCDVVLRGTGVSRTHAAISLDPTGPSIDDQMSSFGLLVDGRRVPSAPLAHGTVLTLGVVRLVVHIEGTTLSLMQSHDPEATRVSSDSTSSPTTIHIGRDTGNHIQCNHPLVSRFHATIRRNGEGEYTIVDHQSSNGTYVNGRMVKQTRLCGGDIVQIGPFRFFLEDGELLRVDDYNRVRVETSGLCVSRGNRPILRDVSVAIQPGELVGILGPSGAGKTTLAHALTGRIPAQQGQVYINGMPLRRFSSAFTAAMGFVTQHNLLHDELTVFETFCEQSLLRLPRDSLPAERYDRVRQVLELLDLGRLADRQVRALSGGEAKRVHMGIELLSSPALIFLDEPLAGLDSSLIRSFMGLFRRISDNGHTVLLATHTLEHIDLCDRILFLNEGRTVYCGHPARMSAAFGVRQLGEVYDKVKSGFVVEASDTSERLGMEQGREPGATEEMEQDGPPPRLRTHRPAPFLRQFRALCLRYLRVLVRDRRNLGVLFSQAPLISVLLVLVYQHDIGFFPISFYFCLTISALWIGGINSVREIAREGEIISRDYRAGLSLSAYLGAKVVVLGLLACVEAVLFGLFVHAFFANFTLDVSAAVLLVAAATGGTVLGLAISALSGRVNRAIGWLPVTLIPQVFFSGVLMPFDRMSAVGRLVSRLTVARPVFSLFKETFLLERSLWVSREWIPLFALLPALIILSYVGLRLRIVRSCRLT